MPSRHSSHDVGAISTGRSRSKKLHRRPTAVSGALADSRQQQSSDSAHCPLLPSEDFPGRVLGGVRLVNPFARAKDRLIDELLVRIHVSLSGGDERGGEFLRPVHHHVVTACEADQLAASIVFEARAELLEYDYRAKGLAIRMLTMRKSTAVATVPRAADRRCHGANCQDPPRITRRAQFPVSQAEPSDGAPS